MNDVNDIISKCQARGIQLRLNGEGGVTIDAPASALTPELMVDLRSHKAELLAFLGASKPASQPSSVVIASWLTSFDWDAVHGYSVGRVIVRHGVIHKHELCLSRRSWRHVWGAKYCSDCWPCRDPRARAEWEDKTTTSSL